MNVNEQKAEPLPIVVEGHAFKPNSEGLWSLNEIHQTLSLPESKRPSEWNNSISEELLASGNFRKVDKVGSFADELATIAYAMWVSTAFYLTVARAFVTMRNDAVVSARIAALALIEKDKILSDNMPKADAFMHKAQTIGLSWSEACRAAGVQRSGLAKTYLVHTGLFVKQPHPTDYTEVIKPKSSGFKKGLFKRCDTAFGNREGFRVTASGLVWLQGKAVEINDAVRERNRRESQARRKAAKAAI